MRVFLAESANEARLFDRLDAHVNKVVEMGSLRRLRHEHGEDPSHPGAYGIFAADND
jgi:hypothetical protein